MLGAQETQNSGSEFGHILSRIAHEIFIAVRCSRYRMNLHNLACFLRMLVMKNFEFTFSFLIMITLCI